MNANTLELARLLVAFGKSGIEMAPHPTDADRLRHRPAELPTNLSARLRMHKAAVLELLSGGYVPAQEEAAIIFGERMAMAEGLGMPTHPGSTAWLVAVGEAKASLENAGSVHTQE